MHLSVCSALRKPHHAVPVVHCLLLRRPELARLVRVNKGVGGGGGEKCGYYNSSNHKFVQNWLGISQSRVWIAVGAGEFVRVAASAAAFEEGTTVNERVDKSVGGGIMVESRLNWEQLAPGGDGDQQQQQQQGKSSLVQALHDAARVFQSGLRKQKTLASRPWFPQKWLGMDKNAWIKSLAYQAAIHSLLQAVVEIAARGEGRDRLSHVFVQQRLSLLASPLEDSIRHELASRDPAADDWLWLQQHPLAVAMFVGLIEKDYRFTNITSTNGASNLSSGGDVELLKLAISSTAALLMLGSAAVSNPIFSSTLPIEMCNLMEKLQEFVRMDQVYLFCSGVGLKREFLEFFGSRAADSKKWQEGREGGFWVYLMEQLLRGALVREGVRSRLKSQDTVESLERDLAVLGFFANLGRSTRAYLAAKGVSDSEESLASLLRYLEGGSVLFYPQLATRSIYQLFIEVVCEEMEWLPLYPISTPVKSHETHGDNGKLKKIGNAEKLLAIAVAVQVCSLWVKSFAQQSVWVRQPEGFRAATFLSKSQQRLEECNEAYELVKRSTEDDSFRRGGTEGEKPNGSTDQELRERSADYASSSGATRWGKSWDQSVSDTERWNVSEKLASEGRSLQQVQQQIKSIDKELQSVEIAVAKLELLIKESELAGLAGREKLRADLEKIWSLKREVEFLDSSFKSKAAAKEKRIMEIQVELERNGGLLSQQQSSSAQELELRATPEDRSSQGQRRRKTNGELMMVPNEFDEGVYNEKIAEAAMEEAGAVSKDAITFEKLLKELAELESRIQQSADQSVSVQSLSQEEWERASVYKVASTSALARIDNTLDIELAGEYSGFFMKSIENLKDASLDIWRGSCLLGNDLAAALVLLRRNALGQKLTTREQKILKRTLTDLASVIPIGFLMLLPVTAVGHAAILAAIQKYVPALIPSAYGPERLDVLRRLEQLRHMEPEKPEKPALPPAGNLEGSS